MTGARSAARSAVVRLETVAVLLLLVAFPAGAALDSRRGAPQEDAGPVPGEVASGSGSERGEDPEEAPVEEEGEGDAQSPDEGDAETAEEGDPEPGEEGEEAPGEEVGAGGDPERPPIPARLDPFEPDEDRPEVTVRVSTDARARLTVDGAWKADLEPGETAEIEVKTGDRRFSAVSSDLPSASWTKVFAISEEKEHEIHVRLQRTIRGIQRTERSEGVYRDLDTGLMWPKRDNGFDVTWKEATEHCEGSTMGGFDDWRLPSLAELETLHSLWSQATYKIVNAIYLSACCPWSDRRDSDDAAWNFSFQFRKPFRGHPGYSLGLRALCVRVMTAEELEAPAPAD